MLSYAFSLYLGVWSSSSVFGYVGLGVGVAVFAFILMIACLMHFCGDCSSEMFVLLFQMMSLVFPLCLVDYVF